MLREQVTPDVVSGPAHPEVTALAGRRLAEVDPATYHWFSGDAMVHGTALRDGRALWYRNRWVRSGSVAAALGAAIALRELRTIR